MAIARNIVQISQQARKVADAVSVICPNNRKGPTFVGQDAVGGHIARHGLQNALMKALHSSSCPYTVETISNFFVEEGSIRYVALAGWMSCEMRRRLAEREGDPDGLEASDAGGKAARGNPIYTLG